MSRPRIVVERCGEEAVGDWLRLRRELWPETAEAEHLMEVRGQLERRDAAAFLARSADRRAIGFAEASLRRDHVNGCVSSPVGFLEGIYVAPDRRRRGAARLLCRAAEAWAEDLGCGEFASDALLANRISQRMHLALGFAEMERVVFYRKPLGATPPPPSGT